jgi:hypothetical protein
LVPKFYLGFTHWIIPKSLLNHLNSFHGQKPKFELKLDADSIICSLSHCEMWWSHSTQAQSTASHCQLAPRENDCSWMDIKVSSDWLPSYIKATPPVLDIFKMDRYFPDRPRT